MRTFYAASSAALVLALGVGIATPPPAHASISIGISIGIAPPPLPLYAQPPIPAPGYMWTPGYWAWNAAFNDYYWVPGTWVMPPRIGLLWTPGYWGWNNGAYVFNTGYWGPTVGFYGGVNYGFGYGGFGYGGGYWRGGNFFYNRTVNNFANVRIINVYSRPVAGFGSRVSFNGGAGGLTVRPTAAEMAAARGPHVAPTSVQLSQRRMASQDRDLRASVNHGAPPVAATSRAGVLRGQGAVAARNTPDASIGRQQARGPAPSGRAVATMRPNAVQPRAAQPTVTARAAMNANRGQAAVNARTARSGERLRANEPRMARDNAGEANVRAGEQMRAREPGASMAARPEGGAMARAPAAMGRPEGGGEARPAQQAARAAPADRGRPPGQ